MPSQILPPASSIGNVNVIPFIGNDAVILRVADGRPEIPGGTLEPGEDFLAALRRELLEEAGSRLQSFTLLGAWRCHSTAGKPYRPHLPHPDFYRVVGYGQIEIVGRPTNPGGGEQFTEVAVVPVSEAAAAFRRWQRPDIAALYLQADHTGSGCILLWCHCVAHRRRSRRPAATLPAPPAPPELAQLAQLAIFAPARRDHGVCAQPGSR